MNDLSDLRWLDRPAPRRVDLNNGDHRVFTHQTPSNRIRLDEIELGDHVAGNLRAENAGDEQRRIHAVMDPWSAEEQAFMVRQALAKFERRLR